MDGGSEKDIILFVLSKFRAFVIFFISDSLSLEERT